MTFAEFMGHVFILLLAVGALVGAWFCLCEYTRFGDWLYLARERVKWGEESDLPYGRKGWYMVSYGVVFRDWFFGARRVMPETEDDVPASWKPLNTLGKVRYRQRRTMSEAR